jgi:hypothetical protein
MTDLSPSEWLASCCEEIEKLTRREVPARLSEYVYQLWPFTATGDLTEDQIRKELTNAADLSDVLPADSRVAINEGFLRASSEQVTAGDPIPGAPDEWPELLPLPSLTHPAPPLDPSLLPISLRPWLVDVSAKASMPLEYVAIPALVALGALIGRRVGICPERYEPQWIVPCNLWGAIVGESGRRKSSAVSKGLAHLRPIEWALQEEWAQKGSAVEARRIALEKRAKGGGGKIDEADIEDALHELEKLPRGAKRIKTNDATIEKLACLLNENPDGILIERDELPAWMRSMERAGREQDRGFYLEGWSGTKSCTVDRMSRATIHVPAVCLSVIGTIQPGPLSEYLVGATGGGSGADGLLQRFQLLAWPDAPPEWHKVETYPDEAAATRAEGVYLRLHRAGPLALGAEPRTKGARVPGLVYDAHGQAIYDRWQAGHEARLCSREFSGRDAFESHLSKYRSLLPKLSLVLHLADHADGSQVGELAALQAVGWIRWLEQHARKVYAPEETPAMMGSRALAEKISAGAVNSGMTIRDLCRPQWRHLGTKDLVDDAVKVLARLGWLRTKTQPTAGRTRTEVTINPMAQVGL